MSDILDRLEILHRIIEKRIAVADRQIEDASGRLAVAEQVHREAIENRSAAMLEHSHVGAMLRLMKANHDD